MNKYLNIKHLTKSKLLDEKNGIFVNSYKKLILVGIISLMGFSLFCEGIDFSKSKLEKLTNMLGLENEQIIEMKKIIAEDSLFLKEGVAIKPDMDTIDEIIDNRKLRLIMILERAEGILDEKQFAKYLDYKAGIVTDKFIVSLSDKLLFTSVQKIIINEIMNLIKKIKPKNNEMMLQGENDRPGMDRGQNKSGGNRGNRPDDRAFNKRNNPVIEIFQTNLERILTEKQYISYETIQNDIVEELKKQFPEKSERGGRGGPESMGHGDSNQGGNNGMGR